MAINIIFLKFNMFFLDTKENKNYVIRVCAFAHIFPVGYFGPILSDRIILSGGKKEIVMP